MNLTFLFFLSRCYYSLCFPWSSKLSWDESKVKERLEKLFAVFQFDSFSLYLLTWIEVKRCSSFSKFSMSFSYQLNQNVEYFSPSIFQLFFKIIFHKLKTTTVIDAMIIKRYVIICNLWPNKLSNKILQISSPAESSNRYKKKNSYLKIEIPVSHGT